MEKLKFLDISDTDIDSGLEYLPASIKEIDCSNRNRSESKVKAIEQQLKSSSLFSFENGKYCTK